MPKTYLCYFKGLEEQWEAICVDFDISVQGRSVDDAKAKLTEAVHSFVFAAAQETPVNRDRLMRRRTPFVERLRLRALTVLSALSSKADRAGSKVHFALPCRA